MNLDFSWLNESMEEIVEDIVSRIEKITGRNALDREEIIQNIEDLWTDHMYITAEEISDHVRDYVFEKIENILERKGIL